MKITVLGSASGMADLNRNSSAYSIETEDQTFLIETGDGVVRQMLRYDKNPLEVDAIFITHTHSDHVSGLFFLLQWMHLKNRRKDLDLFLPQSLVAGFEKTLPYFQIYQEKLPFKIHFKSIKPGRVYNSDSFWLECFSNDHLSGNHSFAEKRGLSTESYSFSFGEENKCLLYTSDVNNLDHLKEKVDSIDLLLCEWTHISIDDIFDFSRSMQINQIILTHIAPEQDTAALLNHKINRSHSVQIAEDGLMIEV